MKRPTKHARRCSACGQRIGLSLTPEDVAAGDVAPAARFDFSAAWTGKEMLVWGGYTLVKKSGWKLVKETTSVTASAPVVEEQKAQE